MKHPSEPGISKAGGTIDQRDYLTAYLLGELPAEEELALERDYFVDDAAYERLLVVEDELAFDFAEGRLSPERRARFEKTIGAGERGRENVQFAQSLLAALRASERATALSARYWWIAAAAALILLAASAWLAFRVSALNTQLAQVRAESAASQARLESQLAATRNVPPPAAIEVAFLLTPGLSRSGDGPARLEVSPEVSTLRFELVPPPGAASETKRGDFAIVIRSASGGQVWSHGASLSGRTWIAQAPAKLFTTGAYEIALRQLTSGEQAPDLATYPFRLIRK
jgi:anti-sigma factor RsiW